MPTVARGMRSGGGQRDRRRAGVGEIRRVRTLPPAKESSRPRRRQVAKAGSTKCRVCARASGAAQGVTGTRSVVSKQR